MPTTTQVTYRLPVELNEAVRRQAQIEERTQTAILCRALWGYLYQVHGFRPTHRILPESGEPIDVHLDPEGAAYTYDEWRTQTKADYECTSEGEWLFQGSPFAGRVVKL